MPNFAEAGVIFKAKDFNKFVSNFGKANSAIERFNRMIDRSIGRLASWEAALRKVAGYVVRGFVTAIASGVLAVGAMTTAGVGLAASFEDSFADVTKTVDVFIDRTETAKNGFITLTGAGESFRAGLLRISNRIPVTFEELSRIAGLGGQLGIINELAGPEAEDALLRFTETVAGLAEATNLTQEIAGTGLAQISNVYRESITDIGDNIERLGSTIVELGNTSATTESKILNFTSRIAGASQTIGITQAEMLGIATAFSAIGLTAEAGSTAVNRAFLIMNEAINQSSGEFLDNSGAIEKAINKLSKLNSKLVRLEQGEEGLGKSLTAQRDEWLAAGKAAEDFGRTLGDTRREQLFRTQDEVDKLTQKLQVLRLTQGQALTTEVFDEFLRVINQVRIGTELTGEEFRKLFRDDPAEAFTLFIEGLALEGNRAGEVLEKLGLNSVEAQRAFLAIAGASDSVRESILRASGAFEANAALAEEVATRYATLVSRLDTFKNITRNTSAVLFQGLIPSMIALLDEAGEVVEVFGVKIPQTVNILVSKTIPELQRAFGGVEIPNFDVSTAINFAFDTLNLRLQATDFTPLGDKLIAFRDGPLADARLAVDWFRENSDLATAALKGLATFAGGAVVFSSLTRLAGLLTAVLSPMGLMTAAAISLGIAWDTNFMGMRDTTVAIIDEIKPKILDLWGTLNEPPGFGGSLIGSLEPQMDSFIGKAEKFWAVMQAPPGFEGSLLTGEVANTPSGFVDALETLEAPTALLTLLEELNEQAIIFRETIEFPTEGIDNLKESFVGLKDEVFTLFGLTEKIANLGAGEFLGHLFNIVTQTPADQLAGILDAVGGIVNLADAIFEMDQTAALAAASEFGSGLADALLAPLKNLINEFNLQETLAPIFQLDENNILIPFLKSLFIADQPVSSTITSQISQSFTATLQAVWDESWESIKNNISRTDANAILSDIQILPPSFVLVGQEVLLSIQQTRDAFKTAIFGVGLEPPSFDKVLAKAREVIDTIKSWMRAVFDFELPSFPEFPTFRRDVNIEPSIDQTELDAVVGTMADDVIAGLESEKSGLQTAWEEWFVDPIESGIQKGKDALGIQSPSEVTIQMGADTIDGFIAGLEGGEERFLSWMSNLTNVTILGFQGLSSAITTTVMPSINAVNVEFGVFYQETLPMTTSAIVDSLIPAKIQLTETNELFLIPSVERLISTEEDLADTLTGNVMSAIGQIIVTKDRLTSETDNLRDEVDKLTESYELLADAIKKAVSAGSGSISSPGTAAAPPEFKTGGSFIVPPSVGPQGMPIIVHSKELVQITPADMVKNVVKLPDIPIRTSQTVNSMPIAGATNNNINSGNVTTSNNKELHLHVNQSVGPNVQDNFELMEALS